MNRFNYVIIAALRANITCSQAPLVNKYVSKQRFATRFAVLLAFAVLLFSPSSATIINIPDDYTTIQAGIDSSVDGDTVLVQPGTYVENINFNGHNIVLGSLFLTTGDASYIEQTVIDGNSAGSVVTFESGEDSTAAIRGFKLLHGYNHMGGGIYCHSSSPLISNNIITLNVTDDYGLGVGIYLSNHHGKIHGNIIKNNFPNVSNVNGGGIYGVSCSCEFINNLVLNNSTGFATDYSWSKGGGICLENCECLLSNNVFYNNRAVASVPQGGGIYVYASEIVILNNTILDNTFGPYAARYELEHYNSDVTIINSIIWSSWQDEVIFGWAPYPVVSYSDIKGSYNGEENINLNPLFVDPENSDFHLLPGSPCIDTGDPNSPLDPDSTRADMGALFFDQTVSIDDLFQISLRYTLAQNYPNPFNASTTIKYELPNQARVTIDIYDILGRKVTTLIDRQQQAGYHQAIWQADDFSSGMYFYKIQAGDYIESKKMLLLK
ncbi:MAG: T9SS type A sorting domain-containing protein [candidate division Zixibacteria bacterium]|nr:T9SS type A sorting domain-containing protein [candidate division Zixibacteria bacterium]